MWVVSSAGSSWLQVTAWEVLRMAQGVMSRAELVARCGVLELEMQKSQELVCAYTQKLNEVIAQHEELFMKYQEVVRELMVTRQRLECAKEQMEVNETVSQGGSENVCQ